MKLPTHAPPSCLQEIRSIVFVLHDHQNGPKLTQIQKDYQNLFTLIKNLAKLIELDKEKREKSISPTKRTFWPPKFARKVGQNNT